MSVSTSTVETPADLFRNSRFSRDVRDITVHVMRTRGLGRRAASRFVGRRLTETTLAHWRTTHRFPIGFRQGSKRGYRPA